MNDMSDDEIHALYATYGYYVNGAMFNPVDDRLRQAAAIFRANIEGADAWVTVGGQWFPVVDATEWAEDAEMDYLR